jgi:hypothetical protein
VIKLGFESRFSYFRTFNYAPVVDENDDRKDYKGDKPNTDRLVNKVAIKGKIDDSGVLKKRGEMNKNLVARIQNKAT